MKKEKGFTLIELLAVIVILAIIALIAIPVILNMISKARKSAAKDSAYGYIDAINNNNDLASMNSDYGLDYHKINDGETVSVESINSIVKMKGKKPTRGTVTIVNGKVVSANNLCFDGYKIKYENRTVTILGDCNSQIEDPESFSTDSWATIVNAVQNNNTSLYNVGDTKYVDLGPYGTHEVRIVNKTSPAECRTTGFSQTACGFVLEFTDIVFSCNLENGDSGSWINSSTYTALNSETSISGSCGFTTSLYSNMPSALKEGIIPTYSVSAKGSRSVDGPFTTTSKLYLLSRKEILGVDNYDDAASSTRQLEYWTGKTNNDRKKYATGETTASAWWLRTCQGGRNFAAIYDGGGPNDASGFYNKGISPAFRIG